jgi:predicted RNA-binding Zn ribbon-like protein
MSPRYDVPKAAPEPLRRVQLFINSVDLEHETDWLPDWLRERGLEQERERATELREALRALVLANNGLPVDPGAVALVDRAAGRLSLRLDPDGRPRIAVDGDALDELVAVALRAMLDGSWRRLKACRNCRWSFYDYSPNRSATWCSMQLCGNRRKTRAYRSRRRAQP